MEETLDLRSDVELATSVSDKHLDLLRPSARSYSIFRGIDDMPIYLKMHKWFYFFPKFLPIISLLMGSKDLGCVLSSKLNFRTCDC